MLFHFSGLTLLRYPLYGSASRRTPGQLTVIMALFLHCYSADHSSECFSKVSLETLKNDGESPVARRCKVMCWQCRSLPSLRLLGAWVSWDRGAVISFVSGDSPRWASGYGQWTEHDGPHLSGGKPQWATVGEPGSSRDPGHNFSASGSRGHRRIVPYREVLLDESPGWPESRWVLLMADSTSVWSISPSQA